MTKKLTKHQIDSLRSVSVRGERYVHLEELQALLAEEDEDGSKADVAGKTSHSGDRAKAG